MRRVLFMAVLFIAATSCKNSTSDNSLVNMDADHRNSRRLSGVDSLMNESASLSQLNFVTDKDTTCGMPLSAGVTDTLVYKGQVFGFCAAACKQQFTALLAGEPGAETRQ